MVIRWAQLQSHTHTQPRVSLTFSRPSFRQTFLPLGVSLKLQLHLLFHSKMPQDSAASLKHHASPGTARLCSRAKGSMEGNMATCCLVLEWTVHSFWWVHVLTVFLTVSVQMENKPGSQNICSTQHGGNMGTWKNRQQTVCIILSAISGMDRLKGTNNTDRPQRDAKWP